MFIRKTLFVLAGLLLAALPAQAQDQDQDQAATENPVTQAENPVMPVEDPLTQIESPDRQSLKSGLAALASDEDSTRLEAIDAIAGLGAAAVGPLVGLLVAGEDPPAAAARVALEALANRVTAPGMENERIEVAQALMAEVISEHPAEVRRWLLRLVALAGGDEVTLNLYDLIQDPELAKMAVWALARIPSDDAAMHLQIAIETQPAGHEASLIDALVRRNAFPDIGLLIFYTADADETIRLAAINGLGKIPDTKGADALLLRARNGQGRESRLAWSAYAELADTLLEDGQTEAARSLFGKVIETAPETQHRIAGLRGIARLDGVKASPMLLDAIHGESIELAGAAIGMLAGMEDQAAVQHLISAMAGAAEPVQLQIIGALAGRGDMDAVPALAKALAAGDDAVRCAALAALADLNAANAAEKILEALDAGGDSVRAAAARALERIEGEAVTQSIANHCLGCRPETRTALYKVLGARRDPIALGTLLSGATNPREDMRIAAIRALGYLNQRGAVPALVQQLRWGGEAEKAAARDAIYRLDDEGATEALIATLQRSPDEVRVSIISALGSRHDPRLKDAFMKSTYDPCVDVATTALDALGRLRDFSTVPRLLEIVREGWPDERAAALKAYALVGEGMAESGKTSEAMAIYEKVLLLAQDEQVKITAIGKLGKLKDDGAFEKLLPYLEANSDRVREAAAVAVGPMALRHAAEATGDLEDWVVSVLEAVVIHSSRTGDVERAAAVLRSAGHTVEVPIRPGYLKRYWVAGPFSGRNELMKGDAFRVELPVDLAENVEYLDATHAWKVKHVDHLQGRLNLLETVADVQDAGAYLYAEVWSKKYQRASLKMGSDDDIYCWLNFDLVHTFEGGRGWVADQDTAEVVLQPGTNTILLKVLNGGGDWMVSLRITDRDGNPLDLEQKQPPAI